MSITAKFVADLVGGKITGEELLPLSGFASASSAGPGDLTFAEKEHHFQAATQSGAAAILVPETFTATDKTLIHVPDVRAAAARLLPIFHPPEIYPPGIHPSAVVDPTAHIDPTAHLGPHVAVGRNTRIGAHSALLGGNHVGADCQIGGHCLLYPSAIVYHGCRLGNRVILHSGVIVGSDGYGYTFTEGQHVKILQVGGVLLEDDVEIGANSTIDRGALDSTVIGRGTKIDNLVHIAHNAKLGHHTLALGQVGIAGSTEIGDYTVVASQTGIAGHLKIGRQVTIGAKSGIMRDIPDHANVLGVPAVPTKQAKRQWLGIQQLPDLLKRVKALEKRQAELDSPADE